MRWNKINHGCAIIIAITCRKIIYPLSEVASVGTAAEDAATEEELMKVGVGTGAAWMPEG